MHAIPRNVVVTSIYLLLSPIIYAQQPWKKAAMEMQSRWAKEVGPSNTYQVYPRPLMERMNWANLNGLWEYAITSDTLNLPSHFDGKILVPYPLESALSGVKRMLMPNEYLWYKREFNKPTSKDGDRILLNFGAVDWQATVFINGKKAGEHQGGYTSFSFDITKFLEEGKNEILVKVFDPSDQGIGPHGKQVLHPANIYYTPSSGIWQTVWLETVSKVYIETLKLTPNIDDNSLSITINTNNNEQFYSIEATAYEAKKPIMVVNGRPSNELRLPLTNSRLWSPDDPFLYNLTVKLLYKGKVVDEIRSYFGMRKIEVKKDEKGFDRIFLNNRYTYNLGVLDQGFWPEGLYTAPTDEALAFDIKAIKEMGFNTIRKHIKIEPARWYYYADKLGMLVWQDFVNPNQGLPAGAKEEFEREVKETLDQLYNYPSITTWVLFNERWGQYDQARLTAWVKQYDPSRIVNGHSGELLYVNDRLRDTTNTPYINSDLTDVHSYPDPKNALKLPGKARVLGEFGGVGVSVPYHQWDDLQGWGYVQATPVELKSKYVRMMEQIKQLEAEGLSGSIYTQPFDVEGEENGLLTYDREIIKVPVDTLRRINSLLLPNITAGRPNKNFYLAHNIDIHDTDAIYSDLLSAYDKGNRDSAFLRRLVLMSIRKRDSLRTYEISRTYLDQRKQVYNKEILNFIQIITNSSKDPGFTLFLKDSVRVNAILGPGKAERKIKEIIEKEEITPFVTNVNNPNWDSIQSRIIIKYGPLGEEFVIGRRMLYYWTVTKDWKNLGKYYVLYFERALHKSEYHINNVSWEIFEHVNDPKILAFAEKIMKYNLDYFDETDPNALDTYANILYKLGKKSEALDWENKAVKLSGNEKIYLETYEKMRNGIPTWYVNNN